MSAPEDRNETSSTKQRSKLTKLEPVKTLDENSKRRDLDDPDEVSDLTRELLDLYEIPFRR